MTIGEAFGSLDEQFAKRPSIRKTIGNHQMNNTTHSNVIIGSRIALAMAVAAGSPVRNRFADRSERKRIAVARMARRCASIKKRSRQLLDEVKAQDAALSADRAGLKGNQTKDGTDIMASVVAKMVDQQIALHSRMENMLDEMMQLIQGRESI
jgi:flagellar motility protein MotE (MotC chaperone)